MENLEETAKETSKSTMGFFKYVFKMDSDEKNEVWNILQYTVLAILPVLVILQFIKKYVPEPDDDKDTLVVLAEVLGQIFLMFLSVYFIHRMIVYIPTFSGIKYGDFNLTNFVLLFLMVILSIQTKLGEKVTYLVRRLESVWEGNRNLKDDNKKDGKVKVTQPLSQVPSHIPSRADTLGGPMGPPPAQQTNNKSMTNELQPQGNDPNFDSMYESSTTPLVDAQVPGQKEYNQMESMEPMAANEGFGGAFGSAF